MGKISKMGEEAIEGKSGNQHQKKSGTTRAFLPHSNIVIQITVFPHPVSLSCEVDLITFFCCYFFLFFFFKREIQPTACRGAQVAAYKRAVRSVHGAAMHDQRVERRSMQSGPLRGQQKRQPAQNIP